jgi:hypothetical protein
MLVERTSGTSGMPSMNRSHDKRSTSLERDAAEYHRIEHLANRIIEQFGESDALQTVMALRLAAQKIYDSRCRDRSTPDGALE